MKLYEVLTALSSLARTGWMLRGVPHAVAESVSEHLFASALIAYEIALLARKRGIPVEPERAMAIALVHDLAEAVIGDISKRAGLGEEKERIEREAFESLEVEEGLKDLHREYAKGSSTEAIIARVADNLATYLVATRYMALGYRVDDIAQGSIEKAWQVAREGAVEEVLKEFLSRLSSR